MKLIGINCDEYKTSRFRRGLTREGFQLEYDGPSGIAGIHLFRIEVPDEEFAGTTQRLTKILKTLELEVKRSN